MIVKTLDQFKKIIPTAVGVKDWEDLQTFAESAEHWLQHKIMGIPLYEHVSAADFADSRLITICARVICNRAYWDAIPYLDVEHTGSGFGVIHNNNKAPASKERIERLRTQCWSNAAGATDDLIEYLELHAEYHDLWKSSPQFSVLSGCLIQTANELKEYSRWTGTREDFLSLRPLIIRYTAIFLEPVFSIDLIENLLEKQRDNDLTADDKELLSQLKFILGAFVDDDTTSGTRLIQKALRFVDEHLNSFAVYTNSKEYAARMQENYENTEDSPIFSSLF